jgi:hypothetical protein
MLFRRKVLFLLLGLCALVFFFISTNSAYYHLVTLASFGCSTIPCMISSIKTRLQKDDSVIIVQVNKGFIEMSLNLLCSIQKAGIPTNTIQIWSMDSFTHSLFQRQHIHTFYEENRYQGTTESVNYHSEEYNRMMRMRAEFWEQVNQKLPFWWIDADISLGKDIRKLDTTGDITIQIDGPTKVPEIDGRHLHGCAGFFFVNSNQRTTKLFKKVKDFLSLHEDLEDQQVLNIVLSNQNDSTWVHSNDPSNTKIRYNYFTQDDVWSGHMMIHGWAQDPFAVHMNALQKHDKILLLKLMKKWYLDDDGNCS